MSIHPNHRPVTGGSRLAQAIKAGFATVALTSAVTALGAIVGAGSVSAATAQPAAAAVSGMTWHQLTPVNGWQSGGAHFGSGSLAWAVRNGVVYLSGSVFPPTGTASEFAVLPAAARPSRVLYITVYTADDTQGFISIYPDGVMYASASPYSNAQGYTSLAGISFPAPALAMHKLALQNGWQSSQSQFGTGDPAYSVSGGVAYLSGSLHQPSGTNQILAVLPPAARPAHTMYLSVYTYNGTIGLLEVDPQGRLYAYDGGAQQYTSLAGISFPVASAAVAKLALVHGWESAQPKFGTGDPAYSVSGGVVHLSGSLFQPSGTNQIFAVLPKADRPGRILYIQVMVYTPDAVALAGTVEIDPDGSVWAYSQTGTARQYTSLAGISYPLGS
jgi:hypothetical protein